MRRLISGAALFILISGHSFQLTYGFLRGKEGGKSKNAPLEVQNEEAMEIMEMASLAQQKKKYKEALDLYKQIYKKYPASYYSPEAYFQSGEIYLAQNNLKKAFQSYNFSIVRHPDFPRFNEVLEKQFFIGDKTMQSKSGQYFHIVKFHNYDAAITYFETIIGNAPYSEYAPRSLMKIAIMHRKQKQEAEAIDALDRLISFYSFSDVVPDAYLELADTFSSMVAGPDYDQGATREAISYYRDFLILFPDSDLVAEGEEKMAEMHDIHARSKFVIGEYYFKRHANYHAAEVFFNDAITVSPNSPTAQKARTYLTKIETLKNELGIEEDDEIFASMEEKKPVRLKFLNKNKDIEDKQSSQEDKDTTGFKLFSKKGDADDKPVVKDVDTTDSFQTMIKDEEKEDTPVAEEKKNFMHLGLFKKKETPEVMPVANEETNTENLEPSIENQKGEEPIATTEEKKQARLRIFNKKNNSEDNLVIKEEKNPIRLRLFNKNRNMEDDINQMEDTHINSLKDEEAN